MTAQQTRRLLLTGGAAIIAATGGPAYAQTTTPTPTAGTAAGTPVENTAQASYTVNGNPQTVASNTAKFVVDRKVNLTVVATDSAATTVNYGELNAVTRFTVTNNTNAPQDFLLLPFQSLLQGILSGDDNYDVSNIRVFADDGDGVFDPAKDTKTFIDELPEDASRIVFIVGDVPSNNNSATNAQVGLQVITAAGGALGTQGSPLVETPLNTINQDTEIDVVFADNDNDGTLGYDKPRNAQGWAYQAYTVGARTVALTVAKSATVLSDGYSGLNPKALPGAVVQYCLTVRNATPLVPATNFALTDRLPTTVTYVAGSLLVGGLGSDGACVTGGISINDDGTSTGAYGGSYNRDTRTVTATIPSVAGGTSVAASFRVTIN